MSPVPATLPEEKASSPAPGDETRADANGDVAPPAKEPPVTVIEAQHPWWPLVDFAELWRHREMLSSLTMREIMRRYKQTVLGVVWAVFPVLGNTALIGLFFGHFLQMRMGSMEEVGLYIFTGMLPWYLFANVLTSTSNSVVEHTDLINKVYFPRLILPLSCIADRLIDFAIGLAILCVALLFYQGKYIPGSDLVLLPVVVLGLVVTGLGVGLIMAAAGVAYRDVFHALALLTQFWFFATPAIFYDSQALPPWLQPWLPLNPVYGLVVNFRQIMIGRELDLPALLISLGVTAVLFVIGLAYFQRSQRTFADVI